MTHFRWISRRALKGLYIVLGTYVIIKMRYLLLQIPWLFQGGALVDDWVIRTEWCLFVAAVWFVFAFFVRRTAQRRDWKLPLPMLFFAMSGLSVALMLFPSCLGMSLGPLATRSLIMTPFGLLLAVVSYFYFRPIRPYPTMEESNVMTPRWLSMGFTLIVALGTTTLLAAFLWLPLRKGPAVGDENYIWWSASYQLPISGLAEYMRIYPQRHYSPGYPCISNVFLGFVPRSFLTQAGVVLPFLYGMAMFGFLVPWIKRRTISLSWCAAAFVAFNFMIFSHQWLYLMSFQKWYGEAMGVCLVTSLFLAMDPSCFSIRSPVLESLVMIGLGVIFRLSKPPLETLVVPVVLPVLFLLNFLLNRGSETWKTTATRLAWITAGAIIGQCLWHRLLSLYHHTGHYEFPLELYTHFSLRPGLSYEIPDFVFHYKQIWVAYLICAIAALQLDARQYLPALAASFLLILSIFALYATAFSHIPYALGSGSRYIMHGAYGFVFYFLTKSGPNLVETGLTWFRTKHTPLARER